MSANKNDKNQPDAMAAKHEDSSGFLMPLQERSNEEEATPPSLWLITFTDIMALMLTFFVLLYSMSVPEEDVWEQITEGIQSEFRKTYSAEWSQGSQQTLSIDKVDVSKAQSLSYLNSVIANAIERDQRFENIRLIPQKKHLIVSLPQKLLFEAGQADVNAKGKQALFALTNTLVRIRNRIEIIGHTDPDPISSNNGAYESNWDLSLQRAGSVASVLDSAGYNKPITIRGLSSARYDDLPVEMSEEERLSLARRVDIVIMNDHGIKQKNNFEFDIFK